MNINAGGNTPEKNEPRTCANTCEAELSHPLRQHPHANTISEMVNANRIKTARSRYDYGLATFPFPGKGKTHKSLYKLACLGFEADLTSERIYNDLLAHMQRPQKTPTEVADAVRNARQKVTGSSSELARDSENRPMPKAADMIPGLLEEMAKCGSDEFYKRLQANPPVPEVMSADAIEFLNALYLPHERVLSGECSSDHQQLFTADFLAGMLKGNYRPKFIGLNPFSGQPAPKKSSPQELSYRGDENVTHHRHVLIEFDNAPLELQCRFWYQYLPKDPRVVSVVYSGGKSLHVLLRMDFPDRAAWDEYLRSDEYQEFLRLGADPACKIPSGLTRMPGHFRRDTRRWQQLLWLAPNQEGGAA